MRGRTIFVVAALLTAAFAGCVGDAEDDDASSTNENTTIDTEPERDFTEFSDSGTFTSVGAGGPSVSTGGKSSTSWNVPANTTILYLNVTVEKMQNETSQAGEVSFQYGNECETNNNVVSCEHSDSTENGEAKIVHQGPATGNWEIHFFSENDAGDVSWNFTAAMGVLE